VEQFYPLDAFRSLSPVDQVRFLLRLAFRLTVVARDYYIPQSELLEDPVSVREINELQHRVTAHAFLVLSGDTRRYPDEVLLDIILKDTRERNGLRERVHRAFAEAYQFIHPGSVSATKAPD
jgi:hypothetical protein